MPPGLKAAGAGIVQQQAVVIDLVRDDVSAEVQDGQRQQASAAIAVHKRMNGFK